MKTTKFILFLVWFISPSTSANFYRTLGVDVDTSHDQIIQAYYKRVSEIHAGSHSKGTWLEVRNMRNVLLNPADRERYDQWINSSAYRQLYSEDDSSGPTDSSRSKDSFSKKRSHNREKDHSSAISENFYEMLGMEIDAPMDEIERACYRLGIKLQAESNSETAWQTVHKIRSVLLNSTDREQYDRWISSGVYGRLQLVNGSSRQSSNLSRKSQSNGLSIKKTPRGGKGVHLDLHQALSHPERSTAKKMALTILKWDVDLSVRDNEGKTAFLLTIEKYFPKIFEEILKINAENVVNIPDNDNNFPVHWAILRAKCAHCTPKEHEREALNMLQSLDKRYADFSARNNEGKTPFHLAFEAGLMKIAHWILNRREGSGYLTKQDRNLFVNLSIEQGETKIVRSLLNPPEDRECKPLFWRLTNRFETANLK